jgi:serine O-acetyltransferase
MLRERIRDTLESHQPDPWKNRAVWALIVYYFGVWGLGIRFAPFRWFVSKLYGILSMFTEITSGVTIYRNMKLPGKGLHIIHPTSVYIHPGVVLGERVGVMHNVCIGTNMSGGLPVIGDDVFIGTGASVLGNVKIGDGARIASNSLVINNVPPGAFAIGVPAKNIQVPSVYAQRSKRAKKSEDGETQSAEQHELKDTDRLAVNS